MSLPAYLRLGPLLGLLLVSCADDAATTAASGGAGGASSAGGSTAESGAGNSGAGSGNAAGNSGACRGAPDTSPTFPAPTELDADLVARAAAVIGSCMPDDGVARNATHIWLGHLAAPRSYFRSSAQLACLANASCGCEAIEHCLGWSYARPPESCVGRCDGDVFTGCGDEVQVTIDCSRFGLSCDPDANCVAEAAASCDGSEPASCSADGEVLFCDDDFMRRAPCQSLGFSCVDGKCTGGGAACTAQSSSSKELVDLVGTACSGATLTACVSGSKAEVDCTTYGPEFTCQSRDGSFFCGLAAECVPADNYAAAQPATCDGNLLSFCNAGRLETLDCLALGFSGCEVNSSMNRYGCTPGVVLP
ncbi:MAG TPA: hypothetical protein VHP33_12140 [Polyangiaceae bacterium]|nr:hypothetical protein [Polyangiaceae bacterium]